MQANNFSSQTLLFISRMLRPALSLAQDASTHRRTHHARRSIHGASRQRSAQRSAGFVAIHVALLLLACWMIPVQATAERPGPPENVTAEQAGDSNEVELNWNAPSSSGSSPIRRYVIKRSVDGGEFDRLETVDSSDTADGTSYTYTDPITASEDIVVGVDMTLRYRVRARNADGASDPATNEEDVNFEWHGTTPAVTSTAPGAPTGLSATARVLSISLEWTAPSDDGGAAITGYRIERGSTTGACSGSTDFRVLVLDTMSAVVTYTDTGLTAGDTWCYRVSATNSADTGAASDPPASAAALAAATAPGAPTGLSVTAGRLSIALKWTAPSDDGGADITGYRIERASGDCSGTPSFTPLVADTMKTAVTHTDTGLTAGDTRCYRVSATNSEGTGDASGTASATALPAATKPGAPSNLTAEPGDGQITLRWTASTIGTGESPLAGYYIESSPDKNNADSWKHEDTTLATADSFTHHGLTNGEGVYYRVRAKNEAGQFSDPLMSERITPRTVPDAPTGLSATAKPTSIVLRWTAPVDNGGAPVTGYRIEHTSGDCSGSPTFTRLVTNTRDTAVRYTDTGLNAGAAWCYQVKAINAAGAGDASGTAFATALPFSTPPGAPTGLSAMARLLSIALEWTAPASDGGSAITGYRIERASGDCSGSPSFTELVADTEDTAVSHTDEGLTAGDAWCYRVSAINVAGTGDASNTDSATAVAAVTVPGVPRNLIATGEGGQMSLSWDAPESDGGSAITGYRIESSIYSSTLTWIGGEWRIGWVNWTVRVSNTNNTMTSYTHRGLSPGATWGYRVYAINSVGMGTATRVAYNTTASVPGSPRNMTATAGVNLVSLSWDAPESDGGSAITGYRIERSSYSAYYTWIGGEWIRGWVNWANVVENTNSTATSYTHLDVAPNLLWGYRVYAISAAGESLEASNVASATVLYSSSSRSRTSMSRSRSTAPAPKKPGAPIALRATGAIGQVELNWGVPASDGGAAITGYRVQRSDTGREGSWTNRAEDTQSTRTRYTDSGLASGRTFHYRVAAINSAGRGAWSESARAITTLSPEEILSSRGTLRGFGGSHAGNTLSSLAGRLGRSALDSQSRRASIGGQDLSAFASFGKDDEEGRPDARQAMESVMGLLGVRLPESGELAQGLAAPGATSPAAGFEMGVSPTDGAARASRTGRGDEGASSDEGLDFRRRSSREWIAGSSFEIPLTAGNGFVDEGGGAASGWTFWGNAAFSEFGGEDSQGANQETLSAYMGMDFQGGGNWLMGVAVGSSANDPVSPDEWEFDLLSVTPYAQWSPTQKFNVWGLYSVGRGDAGWSLTGGGELGTELETRMAALGMESVLYQRGRSVLSVKMDGLMVNSVMRATEAFPDIESGMHRLRLAAEGKHGLNEDGKTPAQLNLNIAARMDGSDIEESSHLELGTGFEVSRTSLGLHFGANGRFLVAHSDRDYQDSGASLTASFDPGVRDDGISLSLESNWGVSASRADDIWSDRMRVRSGGLSNARHSSLDVKLAYGANLLSENIRLEPFGEFGFDDAALSGVRFGARIDVGDMGVKNGRGPLLDNMQIEFFSERENMRSTDSEHRFGIEVEVAF